MGHGDEVYIDASFNLHYPEGELTLANLIEEYIKNNKGWERGQRGSSVLRLPWDITNANPMNALR